jgi:hypothetical protein
VLLLGCSTNAFGDRFLAIMRPVNAAATSFQQGVATIGPRSSITDLDKVALPFADAINQTDSKLEAARWPRATARDVRQLVAANAHLVTDLRRADRQNLSPTQWLSQLRVDEAATLQASTVVRRDLGLSVTGS